MARNAGYALLAALTAVVAVISSAIFIGIDHTDADFRDDGAANRGTVDRASAGRWVGTWSASSVSAEPNTFRGLPDTSVRNVVHVSVGGTSTRIHLSNTFSDRPLRITHATVAVAAAPSSPDAAPGTLRRVTFGGRPTAVIPAGRGVTSDAVRLKVPNAVDLLVTTYSPVPSGPVSFHPIARQTSYAARGDHAADESGTAFRGQSPYWRYLSAVDVWTTGAQGTVVCIGDSITDGIRSTAGANRRWTDFLAQRLLTTRGAPRLGVLNQGISGNRVLEDGYGRHVTSGVSGLSRLERDALSQSGTTALVVELGVNDILRSAGSGDPAAILSGLRQMTARAHGRGLRVTGGTLMPFGGHRGFTPQREAVRQEINAEIRAGGVFDDVADFDLALRDPRRPDRLLPQYDSGDHLHPGDAGNQAMADALDLGRLKARAPASL